jgi:ABC-2 type transport system permease protein
MTTLILLGAFLRRDAAIGRSYRFAVVFELLSAATVALLFFFLARVVNTKSILIAGVGHGGYFPFVVVGVSLLGVLDETLLGPSTQLRSDQINGTLEPLLVTPARPWVIVATGPTYTVLRSVGLASATILFAVLVLGVHLTGGIGGCLLAVGLLIPALVMVTGAGLLLAAITIVVRRSHQITSFAATGLGLVCGVYYPVSVLPSAVRTFASALPPTWFFDLERAALFGGPIVLWKLAGLLVAAVVLPAVGAVGLDAALRWARRRGTLTHY